MYRRELALREASSGRESPDLVPALENLSRVDQLLRQSGAAEILLARAIAIRERAEGPDHADVAIEYNAPARLFVVPKKLAESEPLYVRAIQILAKNFGDASKVRRGRSAVPPDARNPRYRRRQQPA